MSAAGAIPHELAPLAREVELAAQRIGPLVARTPLVALPSSDPRLDLRAKLECRQHTGSFKARGASNQVAQLSAGQRRAGVVACSSGNHGKALAWAAARAGVPATILMPDDAYPNKIEACRELGATVELRPGREPAEADCAELVAAGMTLVHPYDSQRTVAGAGSVGLEIAEQWPEVDVVVVPVGGGGLIAGVALALRSRLGARVAIVGAEPAGSPSMARGLAAGAPVEISQRTTEVQGLCPISSGELNIRVATALVEEVGLLPDVVIFEAQKRLIDSGEQVEPAGAASLALVLQGGLPTRLLEGRSATHPLRVAIVVSGGNADPAQVASL
jgi:threonine dehydratase